MITLNCFTNGFAGEKCTVPGKMSKEVEWVYYQNKFDGITIFEGSCIFEYDPREIDTKYRVAWLVEGRCLRPHMYNDIHLVKDRYDRIITHDIDLFLTDPSKFRLMPRMGCRVPREKWGLNLESKFCNSPALCVGRKAETTGHRLRHEIADRFSDRVDVFLDYNRETDLLPYKFAVIVEACREGVCFTEHLLDAIALGCYPIYWGTPFISDYLPPDCVCSFEDLEHLDFILEYLHREPDDYYQDRLFESQSLMGKYEIPEDWMVRNILKELI